MFLDNLIGQNRIMPIANVSLALGGTDTIVAANANNAFAIAELNVSSSAATTLTFKIGDDTVFETNLVANGCYQFKFYEKSISAPTLTKNKAITLTTAGSGTLKLSGVYVDINKVTA